MNITIRPEGKMLKPCETADILEKWYSEYDGRFDAIGEAILLLRAQQAEIEALKAHLNAYQVAYNPAKHGVANEQ